MDLWPVLTWLLIILSGGHLNHLSHSAFAGCMGWS